LRPSCRGCYDQFYWTRCRVCEEPIERVNEGKKLICGKRRCRNAFRQRLGLGRYLDAKNATPKVRSIQLSQKLYRSI
jgi:hypothetical protein